MSQLSRGNYGNLHIISLADYHRMTGQDIVLDNDECLLLCWNTDYSNITFTIQ